MFFCNYHCLGMSQGANIRNVNSLVVKHYVEFKKDNLAYGFLKPKYPFNYYICQQINDVMYNGLFAIPAILTTLCTFFFRKKLLICDPTNL